MDMKRGPRLVGGIASFEHAFEYCDAVLEIERSSWFFPDAHRFPPSDTVRMVSYVVALIQFGRARSALKDFTIVSSARAHCFANAEVFGNVEGVVTAIRLAVERLRASAQAHP
ncbi:hypothetical protein ACWPMX_12290 [Tsuneonella sp. HG094]